MRVLFDECLPRKLRASLPGHEVRTAQQMGWAGKRNGELLRAAAAQFDVFVTLDRNLPYQQNLEGVTLAIVVLSAPTNRLMDLSALLNEVAERLPSLRSGDVIFAGARK